EQEAAKELAAEDSSFAEEDDRLGKRVSALETKLAGLLLRRDPYDRSDVVMEIKSGEGGEESALFAGDLLRMYLRFAERQGWTAEILDATPSDLGGYKDVTVSVKSKGTEAEGVW